MEGTVLKSIRLGIARVCLVVLATLYLAGGVAAVLRRNNARGRLLGTAFAVLVALDILRDFYRKRAAGFDLEDVVETAVSGILLVVIAAYLVQSRRRFETKAS